MDHAEASERIADLAIEPGGLAALPTDPSPDATALMSHVRACPACQANLDAWRRTHEAIRTTITDGGPLRPGSSERRNDPATGSPDVPPPELRAAVEGLATPSSRIPPGSPRRPVILDDRTAATGTGRGVPGAGRDVRPWQGIAAVIAVLLILGSAAVAIDQARRAEAARTSAAELVDLATSLDDVLKADHSWVVGLVGLDGQPAGSVSWSDEEIVVLSAALAPPGEGLEYRCWVERDGARTPIGVMDFNGDVAAWAGSMERYGDLELDRGGHFGVSLETVAGDGGGPPVLIGELPS
ncbi:MAG TPA: anti-sigma factor [Candidatus Limnocylindrales bacterium]|jgi:hypothetical protein